VDKLLSHTLAYNHVLYCMNNETSADPRWGAYWAEYVREKAQTKGESVHITDMFDDWDPADGRVPGARVQDSTTHPYLDRASTIYTVRHPELYSFVDLSNHNVQTDETHYRTALYVRDQVQESGAVRPITSVKIYGGTADTGFDGTYAEGQERFWRNVFAGVSAVRFHRPEAGIGLDSVSLAHLRSMRMLADSLHVFDTAPCTDLLEGRAPNEAFCLGQTGTKYAVYFPEDGTVTLHLPPESKKWTQQWLDVRNHHWQPPATIRTADSLQLSAPGKGHWVAWIRSER
jgi:hypothetical protein